MITPELGVIFPTKDIGPEPKDLLEFGPNAEEVGADFIVAYDHIVGIRPDMVDDSDSGCRFDTDTNIHEVMITLTAIAARTEAIRVISGCLVAPQRETLLIAKQAAQLDIVSGGRLELGVSIGWNEHEYQALGADYKTRAKRLGGQINLMKRLWTEPNVTDEESGIYDVSIKPHPIQKPIPVWVGGLAKQAIERAVDYGDGWLPLGTFDEAMSKRVQYYLEQLSEKPNSHARIMGRVNPWDLSHKASMEEVMDWTEAGATHIAVGSSENVYDNPELYFKDLDVFLSYARKSLSR